MKTDEFILACSYGTAVLSKALEVSAPAEREDGLITPPFPSGLHRAQERRSPESHPTACILTFHLTCQELSRLKSLAQQWAEVIFNLQSFELKVEQESHAHSHTPPQTHPHQQG